MKKRTDILKKGLLPLLSGLAALLLFLGLLPAFAAVTDSGPCGPGSTYSVEDGTLTVSGSGLISDVTPDTIPWKNSLSQIRLLKISDGITGIGANVFLNLSIIEVEVPNSVLQIGDHALGYTVGDTGEFTPIPGFTLSGSSGSAAQAYAQANSFSFKAKVEEGPSGTVGSLRWSLSRAGLLSISGSGAIPDYDTARIVPWAAYASGKDGYRITSVSLSEGVTSIGNYAFSDCRAMTTLSLPTSLTRIGAMAFRNCSALSALTLPSALTSIEQEAFFGCSSISALSLPTGLLSLGDSAFSMTGIKSLALPSTVTEVGSEAFSACDSLLSASLPSLTSLPDRIFAGCGALTNVTLCPMLTEIGESAFEECFSLSQITFPTTLTSIGPRAFLSCSSLRGVILPDSLLTLGEYAFYGCEELTSASTGSGLLELKKSTFENCSRLSSVTLGQSLVLIEERALGNCPSLHSLVVPQSVRAIEPHAIGYYYFEDPDSGVSGAYTKFTDFTPEIIAYTPSAGENYAEENGFTFTTLGLIPSDGGNLTDTASWNINTATGVLMITGSGELPDYLVFEDTPWALYTSYIKTVIYGEGLLNVGSSSFRDCQTLTQVTLPSTVTKIGDYAFAGTGIVSVTLPSGLTVINDGAFDGCSSLASLSLPDGLTSLGQNALRGPNLLRSIFLPESLNFIGSCAVGCDGNNLPVSGFVIRGVSGSIAQNYAERNGLEFREDGYLELTDGESGGKVTLRGSEEEGLTLSFKRTSDSLGPRVFLSNSEFAFLYSLSFSNKTGVFVPEGTLSVSLPLPDGLNPLSLKLFTVGEDGVYLPVSFENDGGALLFTLNGPGELVLTNADLSALVKITVTHVYADGREASPSQSYLGTPGAEYLFEAADVSGVDPDESLLSGVLGTEDLTLTFTYGSSGETQEETSATPAPGPSNRNLGQTLLLIFEILLVLALIAAVVVLFLLMRKKREEESEKTKIASSVSKEERDRFADTIVLSDDKTREIDIQSLFADEPEEDLDATRDGAEGRPAKQGSGPEGRATGQGSVRSGNGMENREVGADNRAARQGTVSNGNGTDGRATGQGSVRNGNGSENRNAGQGTVRGGNGSESRNAGQGSVRGGNGAESRNAGQGTVRGGAESGRNANQGTIRVGSEGGSSDRSGGTRSTGGSSGGSNRRGGDA